MPTSPTVLRLQLGRELRRLREAAGVGREQAAAELECTVSKISKVESGKVAMRPAEVRALLDRYGATERDEVLRLAREARRRSAHRVPDYAKTYVGLESDAREIRTYETELVPGLLQTEDYARAVTRAADPLCDPRVVERLVAARMQRQERLSGDGPLLWAILNEAVIRRQVDSKETMGRQLTHLVEMNEHPNITIQVLPFSAGEHASMGSSFSHLTLADPPEGEIVYLEDLASADYLGRPPQIARYLTAFGSLTQAALNPAASSNFIRSVIGE